VFRRTVALVGFLLVHAAAANGTTSAPEAPARDASDPDGSSYELTADSIEFEKTRKIYIARGNVRIVSKDTELTADWLAFNDAQARGVATGDVVYRTDGDVLRSDFVEFDIDDERGILFNANFVPAGSPFRVEGETIVKRDDKSYAIEKGVFTTCNCPDDEREPWQIHTAEADLEIEGYATAKNTTFEVLGIPIVWLPFMVYPVKTQRESGFLLPVFGYENRHGAMIGVPFFWAALEGLNVTVTPLWMSDRGYKGDLDVAYVYGEKSKGRVAGAYVYDKSIDPYSRNDPFGRNRWEVHGKQDAHLPAGIRAKSQFLFVSDNEYVGDFQDVPGDEDDRFLESNVFVGRSFGGAGRFGASAAVFYFDDLQNPDNLDRDRYLLQRLPTLTGTALPAPVAESIPFLSRLVTAFDVEYTLFKPRHRAMDEFGDLPASYFVGNTFVDTGIDALADPMEPGFPGDPDPDDDDNTMGASGFELDGVFEEGEPLLDDGSRIDLFPRIGLPFRIGSYAEAYPEIGWHQVVYDTHLGGTAERHLLTGRVDLRSRFIRNYGEDIVHILEPRMGYAFVDDLGQNQNDDPLFVPETAVPQSRIRQLDLDNVTDDMADRVDDHNAITAGVGNRVFRRGVEGGSDLLADFYASAEYRLDDAEFGDIFVGGRFFVTERTRIWANLGFDPRAAAISEALINLRHGWLAGHEVGVRYRYVRKIPNFYEDFDSSDRFDGFTDDFNTINQIRTWARIQITPRWAVWDRLTYTFEDSLLLKNQFGVEYTSKCGCWAGGIRVSLNRRTQLRINFDFRLLGLGGPFEKAAVGDMGLLDSFGGV